MDDAMQEDFLVIGAILRAIYQNISNAQHVDAQELKNIADHLTSISKKLHKAVNHARENPRSKQASMVTEEPFEDIIALVWQNAWLLHQRGLDFDSLHDLRNQLRQLHQKLEELYKKGSSKNGVS